MIVGILGFQRSGKSSFAMLIARFLYEKFGQEIYTNMEAGNANIIDKLTDIPINDSSKTFIWDEIQFSLDSRQIAKNVDFTPFISTLGKQNILLIYTCPTPDLIDKRIRNFTSHYAMCKGDDKFIYVQFIDALRETASPVYLIEKDEKYFDYLNYNSLKIIPNIIKANINEYIEFANESQGEWYARNQ